jgi:hypothetical protein
MRILGYLKAIPSLARRVSVSKASSAFTGSLCIALLCFSFTMTSKREKLEYVLGENIYHEGRGESVDSQRKIALITLARAADQDKQWPKSVIATIAQDRAFSWVLDHKIATKRGEKEKWETALQIARSIVNDPDNSLVMPKGWQCVRYYKRTDNKGVSEKSQKWFDRALVPVGTFGSHTAYRDKKGCVTPMRTSV